MDARFMFTMCIPWALVGISHAAEFHVAPEGNDANPGTRNAPFATLEAARDAVRNLKPRTTP